VKKENRKLGTETIQADESHRFYATQLSKNLNVHRTLALASLVGIITTIPKDELPESGGLNETLRNYYDTLLEKKGPASRKVNPKISRDNILTYAP
jgi:hypothetical protein